MELYSCVPFEAKLIWQIKTSTAGCYAETCFTRCFLSAFCEWATDDRVSQSSSSCPGSWPRGGSWRPPNPSDEKVCHEFMSNMNGEPSLRSGPRLFQRATFFHNSKVGALSRNSSWCCRGNLMVFGLQSVKPLCLKNTCSWIQGQRPCLLVTGHWC